MIAALAAAFAVAPAASAMAATNSASSAVGTTDSASSGAGLWTGYLDQADPNVQFRYVASNFTVPSANCTTSNSYASFWVGLDGYGESTVEQTGVLIECSGSDAIYQAWYEVYPDAPQILGYVNPGDSIAASVYYNNGVYNFSLDDKSTGSDWTPEAVCPSGYTCANDQAEAIAEAHYDVTLPKFNPVNFTGSAITSRDGTHGTFADNELWDVEGLIATGTDGLPVDQISGLSNGGSNFTVTWDRPIG